MRCALVGAAVLFGACGKSDPVPTPVTAALPAAPAPKAVDTVTTASPPRDDSAPKVVADPTVDGAALRDKHRKRIAADRSPVTILEGGTPRELGRKICEAVVPKRSDVPVLIKPNIGGFDWFKNPAKTHGDDGVKGRITDPDFVRGVIECLQARGHTQITVADGFTGKPADWDRLAKVSGYAQLAADTRTTLVALDDDGVYDTMPGQPGKPLGISGIDKTSVPTLLMPKLLADHLEHGLYISIPKLKAHRFAVYSLGIKSMQGTAMYSDASPAYHQKWRTHREIDRALAAIKKADPNARKLYVKALETFAERMTDILELEAPDVTLLEGAPAMGGDGFQHLVPTTENVAIGGTNVLLVDRVGAQYLGLWANAELARALGGHQTSPLLEVAAKRFGVDISKPRLAGNGAALLDTPRPAHLVAMGGFEIGEHAHELTAAHVDAAPTIDGTIDDAWSTATPLAYATDWAGRTTQTKTTVRALWSEAGLYLLFELEGTALNTDQSRPVTEERTDLYEEDCVELFLAPDAAARDHYYEIELGPFGHFFDLDIDRKAKRNDAAWSSNARIGTARDEAAHRAVIEVALEFPALVEKLQGGAAFPLGLYRMEGKNPRQYLAAFPTHTPKPSFHVPSAFGELVLAR